MERSAQTGSASQVHFRFSRFSAPYRSRLLQGLCDLQDYCKQELGQDLRVLIRQRRVIDRLLGAYVMDRHASSDGKQLSLVKHALLGCQHLNPWLRGRLAISWENLRVWEEQKVANLRRPLPVPMWVCMVGLSRAHGFTAQDVPLDLSGLSWPYCWKLACCVCCIQGNSSSCVIQTLPFRVLFPSVSLKLQ